MRLGVFAHGMSRSTVLRIGDRFGIDRRSPVGNKIHDTVPELEWRHFPS